MGFRIAEAFVEVKADSTGLREQVDRDVKEAGRGQDIKVGLKVQDGALGGLMSNLAPFILPAVASIGQLTGALGLVPAAIGAAGLAWGTAKVGLSGFSDAVKKGGDDLKALPPNAREAATAIRGLGPAWENLHLDVQSRLFQGVSKDVQRLGIVDLPVLRRGMDSMADSLNQGIHYFTSWATSSKTVADFRTIMDNSSTGAQNLMRALQPVLSIVRDVATVGSQFLPSLTSNFATAAQKAADFVSKARDTGKLHEWIQTGIDAVKTLWGIFKDLFVIVKQVAENPGPVNMLDILKSVTGAVRWLVENMPDLIPIIEALVVVWKVTQIAGWISAALKIPAILKDMAAGQTVLNAVMNANPIGLVVLAIAALVVAGIELYKHWDQVKAFLLATWAVIKDTASAVWGAIKDFIVSTVTNIVNFLTDRWNLARSQTTAVFTAIRDFLTGIWNSIKDMATSIWNAISAFFTAIWNTIKNTATTIWNAIAAFLTSAMNTFRATFESVWNAISGVFTTVWNGIRNTATSIWNGISGFLTGALDGFRGFWSGAWNGIVGDFQNIWGRITGIASSIWNSVTGAFRSGVNSVVNLINGLVDDVDKVLGFLHIALLPRVPLLAAGGVLALAGGGTVGAGFTTNGPMAIVGEGNPSHPEYVIPTDPAHRDNALALYQALGAKLMAGGGILSSIENWVSGSVIGSAVDKLASVIPDGMFRGIASGVGHQIVDAVKAMIDKAQQAFSAAFTGSPDLAGWIQTALGLTGTPQSWAGPLSVLIGRESGGNPNAINRTDSNAAAGHPSQGLMQTIPSTFNAYHQPGTSWNINDPVANIAAGINYIKARYGSIFNVQQANPNLPPKGYDSGGLLPTGLSTVYNGTGKPEAVFTSKQMDALLNGGGRATNYFNVTIDAKSVTEMQSVMQFFNKVQQVARATTASAGRVA